MSTWWDSGPGAEERAKKKEEESKRRVGGASRVWQRPGQKCKVTLISQELAYFTEHNIKSPGGKWERYVCLEGTKNDQGRPIPCPFCLAKEKQEFQVYVGTCINHTGFSTKAGERVTHVKQALVLKGLAKQMFFQQLNIQQKQRGDKWSLAFTAWEIERDSSSTSHTPGIIYNYLGINPREKLIQRIEASGQTRDDWGAYLTPFSVDKLVKYVDPEEAYHIMGIPFTFKAAQTDEPQVNVDDEFGDLDFPGDVAGSDQFDGFDDFGDIDVPLADDGFEPEDSDKKELEDYEALK